MKYFNYKVILPHVGAVVFFIALTVAYFSPIVFDNKDLIQGDMVAVEGMKKSSEDFHKQTGEYSLWSTNMFSGMPEIVYGESPPNVWFYSSKLLRLDLPEFHMGMFFAYLICFYIFMLCIGANVWVAILGALAYALASYNLIIIEAGHVTKGYAMAYIAPMLGGIILAFRKKIVLGTVITLIFGGLEITSSHPQITYYSMLIIGVAGIVYLIHFLRQTNGLSTLSKTFGLLLIAAIFAFLPNAMGMLHLQDYSKDTMRGGSELTIKPDGSHTEDGLPNVGGLEIDYAFSWSYGKMETFTLLIPNLYGGGHDILEPNSETAQQLLQAGANIRALPTYWGDKPFTSGPNYAGAVVCFLFVLSLFILKGPEKWWLLAATILSFLLAWGKNFGILNNFLFEHLPMYNKFRTPEMALIIAGVTMPIMAMLAFKDVIENKISQVQLSKYLKYTLGIVGGLCVFFLVFGSAIFSFSPENNDAGFAQQLTQAGFPQANVNDILQILRDHRQSMLLKDAFRSLVFVALTFAILWLFVNKKIKKATYIVIGLMVLILVDMWTVDRRYLSDINFTDKKKARSILPTEADLQILQDKDPNYRVFNAASNTFNEANTSYFHKSIGGYSPAKLRRYQDIIDFHIAKGLNMDVINMLNTKYFIVQGGQVQYNADALGHAWFVDSICLVANPDEEILALNVFNPRTTAVIDRSKFGEILNNFTPQKDTTASITLTHYQPNKLIYKTSSETSQLAVFSEVFYRHWRASIDGQKVPIVRANYILRSLVIPEGEHEIVFTYDSDIYQISKKISLYSSIVVVLLIVAIGVYYIRRKKIN
ncbi:MAG: YfhO family protein [Lentimicrobiaceae bacterium]|nr:YfhO family protein [Lentimicrobiaceae bacterium]